MFKVQEGIHFILPNLTKCVSRQGLLFDILIYEVYLLRMRQVSGTFFFLTAIM